MAMRDSEIFALRIDIANRCPDRLLQRIPQEQQNLYLVPDADFLEILGGAERSFEV